MSFLYATSVVVSLFIVTLWFLMFLATLAAKGRENFEFGCKATVYLLIPTLLSAGWIVHVITSLK